MIKNEKVKRKGTGKIAPAVYTFVVMLLFMIPFISMGVAPSDDRAQNQDFSSLPELYIDGRFNENVLQQMGNYFEGHFGFRQQLITLDSVINAKFFGISPTDQVVVGSNGWLYYSGTLDDYQRNVVMSDQAAENAAYNISLMQDYVQRRGSRFLFTVAPNKNSLYSDNMPFYEREGSGSKSIDILEEKLDAYEVNYVDLFDTFENDSRILYMQTDTHWNNDGALVAFDTLMTYAEIPHSNYASSVAETQTNFVGDIQTMLYPLSKAAELQPLYPESLEFNYTNDSSDVTDSDITTASSKADAAGRLMMYRDSFGNALLPYFATQYDIARFSKMVPYDLTQIIDLKPDTVIVERAERHIGFFATDAPIMAAPVARINNPTNAIESEATTIDVSEDGSYYVIGGKIDPTTVTNHYSVYVGMVKDDGSVDYLQAFRTTILADSENISDGNDFGYTMRVPKSALTRQQQRVKVVVESNSDSSVVADKIIDLPQS